MAERNVTSGVRFDVPDDELLPITQCVCGQKFTPWQFTIQLGPRDLIECPACNRKLYFRNKIEVIEVY